MANEKKKETALVTTEAPTVPDKVLTQQEQIALANAEDQFVLIREGMVLQAKLVDMALRSTTEDDWDDMGAKRGKIDGKWGTLPYSGTPRLNSSGSRKIRRLAQLQVETFGAVLVEEERDKDGRLTYFCYECKGRVTSPWAPPMSCVGRCDSNNDFHSTRYRYEKNEYGKDERVKYQLPAHQVSRVNIAQQAHTLCTTRGVTHYLSLDNLTWEKVLEHTSVNPDAAPKTAATFGQPTDKPDTPPPPDDPPPPSDADAPQSNGTPPPPSDAKPSTQQITAIKRMAKTAGIATDPVTWWEFVEKEAGAEFSISEHQENEDDAYAKWTIATIEKLKAAIKKRQADG